ncbi:MAG: cohesin domain-containing protein [Bacteroidota bacterium]
MKKIIVFISLLSLMFTLGAMAQQVLTIQNVQAPAVGGAVTMPLNVTNFTNIGAITLKVTYDPAVVTYVGVANQPTSGTFNVDGTTSGVITVGWFGTTPLNITAGKLLDLNFTYNGGTSTVGFNQSACEISNAAGTVLTGVIYQSGSLYSTSGTTPTLTIPTVQAPAVGGAVTMPLNVTNFTNIGAITLKVTYDTAVATYVGVANQPTSGTFNVDGTTKGVITVGWFGTTPLNIGTGKLLDLNLTYKGGTGTVGFNQSACEISNAAGTVLTGVIYQSGSLYSASGTTPTLTIGNVQAPTVGAGGAVTMPLNVTNFTNIGAITLKVTYDPALVTYVGVANQPTSGTFNVDGSTSGVITVGWFGTTPLNIGTGKLLDLNFTYNGGTGTVGFNQSACEISNAAGTPITGVVYQGGSLTLPAAPAAPVLAAPATGAIGQPVSLTLTWGSVTGAATYRVQVAIDNLFTTLVLNDSTVTTASKQVSSLLNNQKYYWRVNAKNVGGTSSYSAVSNFTTISATPTVPVLQTPATGSINQAVSLTLTWGAVGGADTYRVQVATDSLFAAIVVNDSTLTNPSKQVSGLLNNTKYYWRANAKNASGTSSYSTVFNFTTVVAAPGVPLLQTPATGATNQAVSLTLTWGSVTGAATYRVQVATDNLFADVVVDDSTLTAASKVVGSLLNNTKYYWRVNAKNTGGTSSYSTVFNFTTIVAAPAIPVLRAPANGVTGQQISVTLLWDNVAGAVTYRLQFATNSRFTPASMVIDDSTLTTASKVVSSLLLNTQYYWRVNATNIGGTSSYSTVFSFTTGATSVELPGALPKEFSLSQNYPNPFNPSTMINFGLPSQAPVTMEIYNMLGVKVRTLIRGEVMNAGIHQMEWNGKDDAGVSLTSGVYLYRINAGNFQVSKKMMLLK